MHRKSLFIAITILLIVPLLAGCLSFAEEVTPPPGYQAPTLQEAEPTQAVPKFPMVPPDPALGEPIFAEKCAPCHGVTGLGDGPQSGDLPHPAAALSSPAVYRLASPVDWYDMISNGNLERYMPPFSSLSERERWDVISYIYTFSNTPEDAEMGKTLYEANCTECHGENGKGTSLSPIAFADQSFMAEKSAAALYESITNGVGEMPGFDQLTEDERWALTTYIRSLTFVLPEEAITAISETPEVEEADEVVEETEVASETEAGGTVSIQVINASGGEIPVGEDVVLRGYDNMTEVYSQTLTLPEEGVIDISDVPMLENRVYLATMDFDNATYGSNISLVEAGIEAVTLGINIYDTTTDSSVITLDRLHVFFEFIEEDYIQVVHLFVMSNQSEMTLVAENPGEPVVEFMLPEGATNLQFQDGALGQRYISTEKGFADTINVRPSTGEYQVLFAYDMPYDRDKLELSQPVNYPTTAVIIMAPEEGVKIKSDQLESTGSQDVDGVAYSMYSGSSLAAGETLDLTISGRPGGGFNLLSSEGSTTTLMIGIGALGVVLVGAGIFMYNRMNKMEEEFEDEDEILDDLDDEDEDVEDLTTDDLMDAIIALDDRYKANEIPEDAYQVRRAELKEQLRIVMDAE